MAHLRANTRWFTLFLQLLVACLFLITLSRLAIVAWQWPRVAATDGLSTIVLQGIRFDVVTLGLLFGIPFALTPLMLSIKWLSNSWKSLLTVYVLVVVVGLVFMELTTPSFIAEYDSRPNILFVEYLNHPKEVFSMLWVGYKLPLFIVAFVVPAVSIGAYRWISPRVEALDTTAVIPSMLLLPVLLAIAVMSVRSTLDHRPVNPSTVAFSNDPMVNTLALNSTYSVLYAIYELRNEDDKFAYGDYAQDQVIAHTQQQFSTAKNFPNNTAIPTLHWQQATQNFVRPKNLVIVVEESLGAEFVGSMGGLPLTPYLDQLAEEGIWFERLYATGTRSARGLEAIVTGFPPTSSGSVVKLGKSQRNFFTLGELLRRQQYDTSFIYGGESQFDNMRRFFANNGFDTIIDKKDFEDPEFVGSWGICDEELFAEAHKRFLSMPTDRPFFSLVFTSSNHSPFEFPDGKIELYEQPKGTVNNAVKYADYSLGQFFINARKADYWDNTVFLVIADHNSRVFGAELIPVQRFHVPAVIVGGGIKAKKVARLASQIDMVPTLLSLIGINSEHPAIGYDLTRPDIDLIPERAVMQYGGTQGYLEHDQMIIMRKHQPPQQFHFDGKRLTKYKNDPKLVEKALKNAAWPFIAYREGYYRLPPEISTEL